MTKSNRFQAYSEQKISTKILNHRPQPKNNHRNNFTMAVDTKYLINLRARTFLELLPTEDYFPDRGIHFRRPFIREFFFFWEKLYIKHITVYKCNNFQTLNVYTSKTTGLCGILNHKTKKYI